jgi:hypothetical protein
MLRSSAIRPEEEALRVALDEIEEQVRGPGVGHIRGKLNELWALVGAVNAARERGRKNGVGPTDGNLEWAVVDDEGLSQITQVFRLDLFLSFRKLIIIVIVFRYWQNNKLDSLIWPRYCRVHWRI